MWKYRLNTYVTPWVITHEEYFDVPKEYEHIKGRFFKDKSGSWWQAGELSDTPEEVYDQYRELCMNNIEKYEESEYEKIVKAKKALENYKGNNK